MINHIQKFLEEFLRDYGFEILGKYYSFYRGVVVDNNDPEKRMRIKIIVPPVWGNKVNIVWAEPKGTGITGNKGLFHLPKVGDFVWIEFLEGDANLPFWSYGLPKGIPNEMKNDYPKSSIFKLEDFKIYYNYTDKKLIISDNEENNKIEIDKSNNSITINTNSNIIINATNEVVINANTIKLGNTAIKKVVLDGDYTTYADGHRHQVISSATLVLGE